MLVVKNLPAKAEAIKTRVQSLGWEDPLKEGVATHSSILAWRVPWTGKPGSPQGHKVSDATEVMQAQKTFAATDLQTAQPTGGRLAEVRKRKAQRDCKD